jgi:hypothetical protein
LINNDLKPEITHEGRLDAPFGKRLYDEAVVQRLKGVAKLKFWGMYLLGIAMSVLLIVAASTRVFKLTARAIDFETTIDKVKVDGDRIIIPALVLQFQRDSAMPAWAKAKMTPIQVLNFANAKEIPPGAEGKAILLTGATNGLIKARLTEPVKVDGVSLLDAGVLLIGQGRSTEERLFVDFKKAVFRDGKSVSISAQAYDISDTILGLKGSRVGDVTLKLAASSGLNFLSGMAAGLETPAYNQYGMPSRPSVGTAALNGVSQASSEQAKSYMEQIKNRPPIIEVPSGTVFTVTFDGGTQ